MFLSDHDFAVVVCVVRRSPGSSRWRSRCSSAGPSCAASRSLREDARRFGESGAFMPPGARPGRAPAAVATSWPAPASGSPSPAAREAPAGGVPPRAGLVGLPRPAHPAGRAARDDRGARGRAGRATRRATTARSAPRSTGWCGWSTTSSSCPGSTPALCRCPCSPWRCGDLVSEAHRRRRPGRPRRARPARRRRSTRTSRCSADPAGLSRVVANLVMNAIRHTPADGVVESSAGAVAATPSSSRVTDAAEGSPGRASTASSTSPGGARRSAYPGRRRTGAGLGLAIVKGIVEAHRGTVEREQPRAAAAGSWCGCPA